MKIIEKSHTVLLPDLWFQSLNKNLKIHLCEQEHPKKWPGDELFTLTKLKLWVSHFFSVVTS